MEQDDIEDVEDVDFENLSVSTNTSWQIRQKCFVVCIQEKNMLENNLQIISLPHPKTQSMKYVLLQIKLPIVVAKYLVAKNTVLEIQSVSEEPSSWFVGDSVQSGKTIGILLILIEI